MLELSAWLLVVAWWWPLVRVLMDLGDMRELKLGTVIDFLGTAITNMTSSMLLVFCVLVARARQNGVSAPMRVALHAITVPVLFGAAWTILVTVNSLRGGDVPSPFFPSVSIAWWLLVSAVSGALAWTAGDVLDGHNS